VFGRIINFNVMIGSQCDRCLEFKGDVKCVAEAGAAKCKKCQDDRKGCYWDGKTRSGVPKSTRKVAIVEKAQEVKREVVKSERVQEARKEGARGRPGPKGKSREVCPKIASSRIAERQVAVYWCGSVDVEGSEQVVEGKGARD
jgi:hypothetical protein